jgi:hypothetical protein
VQSTVDLVHDLVREGRELLRVELLLARADRRTGQFGFVEFDRCRSRTGRAWDWSRSYLWCLKPVCCSLRFIRSGLPRRSIGHNNGRFAGGALRRSEFAALEASATKDHLANLVVVRRGAMGVNVQTSNDHEAQANEVRNEIDETIRKLRSRLTAVNLASEAAAGVGLTDASWCDAFDFATKRRGHDPQGRNRSLARRESSRSCNSRLCHARDVPHSASRIDPRHLPWLASTPRDRFLGGGQRGAELA